MDLDCCTKASEHVGNVRGHFNAGTENIIVEFVPSLDAVTGADCCVRPGGGIPVR